MKLIALADIVDGRIAGDPETDITGVAGIQEAGQGDITYLADKKNVSALDGLQASAVFVHDKIENISLNMVIVENPQYAFAKALEVFHKKSLQPGGVSEQAVICSGVQTGKDVTVYPAAYISSNVMIGDGVTIFPGVFVGEDTTIGDNTFIYPNVTVREGVRIGKGVIIHAGAVIGADGFGYVQEKGIHYKIPQVGGVIIEDNVEIGANVIIDRATTGNTVVGSGTKIDNLVQIAHNVKIGKNCIIVAQVGISGSVEIGDGTILGGQVGIKDHIKIGKNVMVAAQAGVISNLSEGQIYSGSPALPHHTSLRVNRTFTRLPELAKKVQKLEKLVSKEENSDDR